MAVKDNPATPGIGSGPYGSEPGFNNADTGMEFGISNMKDSSNIPSSSCIPKKGKLMGKRRRRR